MSDNHRLLPNRISAGTKLLGRYSPHDRPISDSNTRFAHGQKTYFEVPVYVPKDTDAARRDEWFEFERKLIWAAFDVPERIPMLLRDRCIAGDVAAFHPETLEAVAHWVKECRYWRCIGIERPFFDEYTLRAHAWQQGGTDVGNVQCSAAMVDALRDLERAVRREEQGLPANYVWDKWGPWGFVDGSRAQYLPRFRAAPYEDPDGVEVNPEDVRDMASHAKIKERYGALIFPDTEPLKGAFLAPTNGCITFHDFDDALRARVMELRGVSSDDECATLSTADDLRVMLYYSALRETLEQPLADAATWEDAVEAVRALREAHDVKVDAARLLLCARELDELRMLYEEKCGFADFHMTPDKELTAATIVHLEDLRTIAESEWGPELITAHVDVQRSAAIGEEAFAVFRELVDMDRDRRRRMWAARFSGDANEEKALDSLLESFARRPDRPTADNEPGEEFDREREPIGRNVQRRVLESDIVGKPQFNISASGDRLKKFAARIKARREMDGLEDVGRNQQVQNKQIV